jgi:hypothetical protein
MFRSATIAPAARAATTVKTFILAYPAIAYESSLGPTSQISDLENHAARCYASGDCCLIE